MSETIIKPAVQYCMTLKFAAALLKKDCHELIACNKRALDWAVSAFGQFGDELVPSRRPGRRECNDLADPYGAIVFHIVNYDAEHGHTPTFEQLAQYMGNVRHGVVEGSSPSDPWFGHDFSKNMGFVSVMEQYLKDNAEPESERKWGLPEDAEVVLPGFIERARRLRLEILCGRAIRLSYGSEEIYDRKMKQKRASNFNDALGQLQRALQFDLAPQGSGTGGVKVPEIPQEALYGWLGQKAVESGMPLGYIYPALFGVYAGKRIKVKGKVHPCVDVALVGDVETGKTQAIEWAEQMLGMKDMSEPGGSVCHRSASSDRGLFNLFGDDPKAKDVPKKTGGTFVMCLTELRHMFTKMAMQNNSLPSALCALWDNGNDVGTADKFKNTGCSVNLSIVGGLKCATMDEFGDVFGADAMHGLHSRFIIATTSEKWEYVPNEGVGERREPCEIRIPPEIWERLKAWRREKPNRGRAAEIALRIAVITEAAEQGRDWLDNISAEDNVFKCLDVSGEPLLIQEHQVWRPAEAPLSMAAFEAALRFMEWQEAVKAAYTPSEAVDEDARCTEAILKALEEHGSFKWNTMCKNRHWARKWGARRVQGVRDSLAKTGQISYDPDTGWVEPV